MIDMVGDFAGLKDSGLKQNPVNLDATCLSLSRGVYRLGDRLPVITDIDRMLACAGGAETAAAA